MVEKLLKLHPRLHSLSSLEVGQPANVCGYQDSVAEVIRNGGGENVDGLVWLVPFQRNRGPDRWHVAILDLSVQGMFVHKLVGNVICLRKIARECEYPRHLHAHVGASA